MLSQKQLDNITKVGELLTKTAMSEDRAERGLLAATGNLYLRNVVNEEMNDVLSALASALES